MKFAKEILMGNERLNDYYNVGQVQRAAVEDYADAILKDIMRVVAAQALNNESALSVFTNLKRIYVEGLPPYSPINTTTNLDF